VEQVLVVSKNVVRDSGANGKSFYSFSQVLWNECQRARIEGSNVKEILFLSSEFLTKEQDIHARFTPFLFVISASSSPESLGFASMPGMSFCKRENLLKGFTPPFK